jgi:flagellar hook protein FlgE
MSLSALGSGLSGMQAFQTALNSSANNVANMDTNGFQPQTVDFQSGTNGGVNVALSAPSAPQSAVAANAPSGTDYATEAVNSMQYKFGFDMSAQVVKTADQTLGTLINITA